MIHAVESEQALIGAAIFDPAACVELFERVKPEHFSEPTHAIMWEYLRGGALLDPVLLSARMKHVPAFEALGGIRYVADLVDKAYVPAAPQHAAAVLSAAMRRQLHQAGAMLIREAEQEGPAEALLGLAERSLAEIARDAVSGPAAAPVGMTALDNLEAAMRGDFRGAETGLACLDRVTGGIKQDDVWFFGGRTSMGKSVMGLTIARGVAQQGRGVLMFSLEMPLREVQARLIADIAHDPNYGEQVRYGDVLQGRLGHDTRDRARGAAKHLASLPMAVTDGGSLTIDDIRHQALRQVRAWEKAGIRPGAVLIDHIGLVKPVRKTDSKAADTADTVNELKGIAKEIRCPIIALAQVNRATENRADKRPTMGDLNWSGSIEQIADFVCLLYREAYYKERGDEQDRMDAVRIRHKLELLIHKNRAGPIVTLDAWADVSCNAIRDLQEDRRAHA